MIIINTLIPKGFSYEEYQALKRILPKCVFKTDTFPSYNMPWDDVDSTYTIQCCENKEELSRAYNVSDLQTAKYIIEDLKAQLEKSAKDCQNLKVQLEQTKQYIIDLKNNL
jgi:hypothetical protein